MVKKYELYELHNENISMANRTVLQFVKPFEPNTQLQSVENEIQDLLEVRENNGKKYIVLEVYASF